MLENRYNNNLHKALCKRVNFMLLSVIISATYLVFAMAFQTVAYAGFPDIDACPDFSDEYDGYTQYVIYRVDNYSGVIDPWEGRCMLYVSNDATQSTNTIKVSASPLNGGTNRMGAYYDGGASSHACYYDDGAGSWVDASGQCNSSGISLSRARAIYNDGTTSPATTTLYESNSLPLYTQTTNQDYYGTGWDYLDNSPNTLIYDIPENVTLTQGSGPYIQGSQIPFTVEWENLSFSPLYIHFYEDINDSEFITYPNISTGGGSGSRLIYHAFDLPSPSGQPYTPLVDVSNCSGDNYATGSGCFVVTDSVDSSMTVISLNETTMDFNYPSTHTISKSILLIDEDVDFTYDVDPAICGGTGSSVTSLTHYLGYPGNWSFADTGSTLATLTGSLTRSYPDASSEIGSGFFPRINVNCISGDSHNLYVGNTWSENFKAVLVTVYTQQEQDNLALYTTPFLNGAFSSGYSLFAEKGGYNLYEPVRLKWTFQPYVDNITEIRLIRDDAATSDYYTFSSANDINNELNHYYQITYSEAGEYYPRIDIYSGAVLGRSIYIGGGETKDLQYPIIVTDEIYAPVGTTIIGLFGSGGIFTYLKNIQIPTSEGMNTYIKPFVYIANTTIGGVTALAEFIYSLILKSNFFIWWADLIAPVESSRTVPETLFRGGSFDGFNISSYFNTRDYTITYAPDDSTGFNSYFGVLLVLATVAYITNRLVH